MHKPKKLLRVEAQGDVDEEFIQRLPEMTDEELEQYERERPPSVSALRTEWESLPEGTEEIIVVDAATNQLYSIFPSPDHRSLVVQPIQLVRQHGAPEFVENKPDGDFDWEKVDETFFPSGYSLLRDEYPQKKGSKEYPQFWRSTLLQLLSGYSARALFVAKAKYNPYEK